VFCCVDRALHHVVVSANGAQLQATSTFVYAFAAVPNVLVSCAQNRIVAFVGNEMLAFDLVRQANGFVCTAAQLQHANAYNFANVRTAAFVNGFVFFTEYRGRNSDNLTAIGPVSGLSVVRSKERWSTTVAMVACADNRHLVTFGRNYVCKIDTASATCDWEPLNGDGWRYIAAATVLGSRVLATSSYSGDLHQIRVDVPPAQCWAITQPRGRWRATTALVRVGAHQLLSFGGATLSRITVPHGAAVPAAAVPAGLTTTNPGPAPGYVRLLQINGSVAQFFFGVNAVVNLDVPDATYRLIQMGVAGAIGLVVAIVLLALQ